MKKLFLFFCLVVLCVGLSSLNLSQNTDKKYTEFLKLAQDNDSDLAESGFRTLAMKYPYTAAGIKAARQIVEAGTAPERLVFEILMTGIRNTTVAEWLVFISALFVVTVFIGGNGMPSILLFPFAISAAGLFHQSHALVSIHSKEFEAFLAVNPYFYIVLTLLITAGYLLRRWQIAGQTAYHRTFVRENIALGDQLLVKGIYLEKLKGLRGRVEMLKNGLQTPHSRHFANEVKRLHETMAMGLKIKQRELESIEAQYQDKIAAEEETIAQTRKELTEYKIQYKTKMLDRIEYERRRLEKEAIIQKSRKRIFEINASKRKVDKSTLGNRLQFMRQSLFLAFLRKSFIDKQDGLGNIDLGSALSDLKTAKLDIKRRMNLYRKSLDAGRKLVRLEQHRGKMKEEVYNAKRLVLIEGKNIIDKILLELVEKISGQIKINKKQNERLESLIQTLTVELEDMKTLRRIRGCFPSHVKGHIMKIRQGIKLCRKTLPILRRIEKIYSDKPRFSSSERTVKERVFFPLMPAAVTSTTKPIRKTFRNESNIITLSEPYERSAPEAPIDLTLTTFDDFIITGERR